MDVPWYNHHLAQRPLSSVSRLPSLSLPQLPGQAQAGSIFGGHGGASASSVASTGRSGSRPSSDESSPPSSYESVHSLGAASKARSLHDRAGDLSAAGPVALSRSPDDSSFVIAASSSGLSEPYGHESYPSHGMDHAQSYLDVHQSHISAGSQPTPPTVTSAAVAHYSPYGQPPLLQPGSATAYSSAQASYGHYPYPNGITSPQTSGHPSTTPAPGSQVPAQLLPLPGTLAPRGSPCSFFFLPPPPLSPSGSVD